MATTYEVQRARYSPEAWERRRQQQKEYQKSEQGRRNWRNRHLVKAYGITIDEFDAMLEAQGGVCAICGSDDPGSKATWHVDHNHATGEVRRLLCVGCNTGLGSFGDDPERLIAAAVYLMEFDDE